MEEYSGKSEQFDQILSKTSEIDGRETKCNAYRLQIFL